MNLFDALARGVGALSDAAGAAGTVLPGSGNRVSAGWTHVTKVDPELDRRLPLLYPLYLQHTDAVSVGGSSDVTAENTVETLDLLARSRPPAFHEPSDPGHVTEETRDRAAFLAVPEVLNGDVEALVGDLGSAVAAMRDEMVPGILAERLPAAVTDRAGDALADVLTDFLLRRAVFEAYVVNNPDSAAAEAAGVEPEDVLDAETARERAMAAERHLGSDVVYLEYSGTYGGDEALEILRRIDGAVDRPRVWYGGGLDDRERTEAVLDVGADAVVVGNAFHRIADAETDLLARAASDLPLGAADDEVADWLDEEAVAPAAGFLATNPAVDAPEETAREYVAATVGAYLGWRGLVEGEDPPNDPASFDEWVTTPTDDPLPGERAVAGALPRGAEPRAFALAVGAALAERPAATQLPVAHLPDV